MADFFSRTNRLIPTKPLFEGKEVTDLQLLPLSLREVGQNHSDVTRTRLRL